jgi:hypothetical protein
MTEKERNKVRDEKRDSIFKEYLGCTYPRARKLLIQELLFDMIKECGDDICHCKGCEQKIKNCKDLSKDHKVSWRKTKDFEGSKELFWDLDNCKWSHVFCNMSRSSAGEGRCKFFGVDVHQDRYRSRIWHDSNRYYLGSYREDSDAAIAYDLFIILFKDSCGILNFSENRENYKKFLSTRYVELKKTDLARELGKLIIIFKELYNVR